MKRIISLFLSILLFHSCEVIEGPYMSGDVNPIDTSNNYVKKVLIEDYTGHLCSFCPDAARELDVILDVYPNAVGLAIHGVNNFTRPYVVDTVFNSDEKYLYDFRTSWGKDLDDFFEVSANGLPKGTVNRIDYSSNGNHRKDFAQWSSLVADELEKEIKFGINIDINQTPLMLSDQFDIIINSEALSSLNGNYKVVVCIAENNITTWQKDGTIDDPNYKHKHVLRSFLTPTWGDNLAGPEINNGDVFSNAYTCIISDLENDNSNYSNTLPLGAGNTGQWNTENLSVIAYIYDISSYEIIQVEEKSFISN